MSNQAFLQAGKDVSMQASELQKLIETGIPGAEVSVRGDGDHFDAVVVSGRFTGLTMVQQHQLVYATLGGRMGGEIHALALKTYTPEDWARQ
jgi:acid stress-induced BolA-like protein IbaG/YrbA